MEKFVTQHPLPTSHEREILTILIEEAAEVQQRATKLLRFGRDEVQPGQDLSNRERLSNELGDMAALVEMAIAEGLVDEELVYAATQAKFKKLEIYMQTA